MISDNIETPYHLRRAIPADIPGLMLLYEDACQDLTIYTQRNAAIWGYLFGAGMMTETAADTWLLVDATETVVGYLRVALHDGFGDGLVVSECSRLDHIGALTVLRHLKTLAMERNTPYIRLNIDAHHTLVKMARYATDAQDMGTYAWQIYVPNVAQLLTKMRPIFEQRLAQSPFANLTRFFVLNFYREAYEMRFENGALLEVKALGFCSQGDLYLPLNLFAPLVLGYRSREALSAAHPDIMCGGETRYLVDVLFPTVKAFIYTQY
jgi:hypothetical protein